MYSRNFTILVRMFYFKLIINKVFLYEIFGLDRVKVNWCTFAQDGIVTRLTFSTTFIFCTSGEFGLEVFIVLDSDLLITSQNLGVLYNKRLRLSMEEITCLK